MSRSPKNRSSPGPMRIMLGLDDGPTTRRARSRKRPMRRGMPSIQHCARDRVVFAAGCRSPDCSSRGGRSDPSTTLRASRFRRCSPGPMHTARTGRWPTCSSGPCLEAPGEHWGSLMSAVHEGQRGLPGGSTFAQLLVKHRGHRSKGHAPRLSIPQILDWALAFQTRHGEWPTSHSGPVAEAPGETWSGIQSALGRGRRGLPGGSTLARLRDSSAAHAPRRRIRRARNLWIILKLVSRCPSRPSRWKRQGVESAQNKSRSGIECAQRRERRRRLADSHESSSLQAILVR